MNLSLDELVTATYGKPVGYSKESLFKGVSVDSRSVRDGEVFVALKGERFDGHDFVGEALIAGASGAILKKIPETIPSNLLEGRALVLVEDTVKALGDLATFWGEKHNTKVVAISGSCGKTTTKEMVSSILSFSYTVLKTEGNLNNLIGLPLTMLRIRGDHEIAVLELGVSKRGEMARLGEISSPDIALLTNIGRAHLSGFKDLNVVSEEKREIFRVLKREGTAIINMDDPLIGMMTKGLQAKRITYGSILHSNTTKDERVKNVDVMLESYTIKEPVRVEFTVSIKGDRFTGELSVLGVPNLLNALSAVAIAFSLNVDWEEIREGLLRFVPLSGRMQMIPLRDEIMVIDDTYNANPSSMELSLKTLSQIKGNGRRIAVLGDMLDLGEETVSAHRDIGKLVSTLKLDRLFSIGRYGEELVKGALLSGMNSSRVSVAEKREDILPELMGSIRKGDWILIKGSRAMGMEFIVESLKDYFQPNILNLKSFVMES